MVDINKALFALFHKDKGKTKTQPDVLTFSVVAAATILGLGVSSLISGIEQPEELSDHPLCGIPTGGQVKDKEFSKHNSGDFVGRMLL